MTTDRIFQILGWTLLSAGALWAALALFRDRAKGRRRCPKCWYSMDGAPALQCPECGHTAHAERRLLRTRRHWRRAALALCVLTAGYACTQIPVYRRSGVYGLIPATYLARFAPAQFPPSIGLGGLSAATLTIGPGPILQGQPTQLVKGIPGSNVAVRSGATTTFLTIPPSGTVTVSANAFLLKPGPISATLHEEIWRRLQSGHMARWQSQLYLERFFKRFPLRHVIPSRWPAGEPIPYAIANSVRGASARARLAGSDWTNIADGLIARDLPTPMSTGPTDARIQLVMNSNVVYSTTLRRCVELCESRETLLTRHRGPEVDARILGLLAPRLVLSDGQPVLRVNDSLADHGIESAVYFTFAIERDGRTLAGGRGHLAWGNSVWKDWEDIPLKLPDGVTPDQLEGATLTLRSDDEAATEYFLERPIGQTPACWSGELRTILHLEHPTGPAPAGD